MPIRTCIACRREREKDQLIRLVRYGGRAVVDYSGKLPGRGAYICPKLSCIEGAMKRARLERALKSEEPLRYQDLPEQIRGAIRGRILALLGIGAKGGKVASGWNGVRAAMGRLKLVLIAQDASENTLRRFSNRANVCTCTRVGVKIGLTKAELGKAIGKPPRSVLGIGDPQLAAKLERELRRLKDVHPGD